MPEKVDDLDPYDKGEREVLLCHFCQKPIMMREDFVQVQERLQSGKPTNSMLAFHNTNAKKCWQEGREVKRIEKNQEKDTKKILPDDYDDW